MLQKIIDFFRSLFGLSKSSSGQPTTTTSSRKETRDDDIPDPYEAQDASEIKPDTVIAVVNETEPIILKPEDLEEEEIKPTEPEEETGPETADPVVEEPEKEPTENVPVAATHKPRYLWCLDNGHGSKTAGKRSPKLGDGRQLLEYRFNRDIVKRIMKSLDQHGVKYFNVVPEVDTDNFLEERVGRANGKKSRLPKLFVSVHSNAAPAPYGKWSNPDIQGIETWYFHKSKKGRKVASIFQKHLIEATRFKNRHIKSQAKNQFYVLRKTSMTAVLTENGFYNNKSECLKLLSDKTRQQIADAHVAAILEIEKKGLL